MPDFSTLSYSTLMGTSDNDAFRTSTIDSNNNLLVAGETNSSSWTLVNANQTIFGGGGDGFVVKFRIQAPTTITPTSIPTNSPTPTFTITPSLTQAPVAGDANESGTVDIEDYLIWISQYLNYNPLTNGDPDFNNDGYVNGQDFVIWLNSFGN